MATSGAIIGRAVPGVIIDDIASTGKTLPQFTSLWEQMLA
jgi:3-phosphoshikimate 1-carboxyvinyltransferase